MSNSNQLTARTEFAAAINQICNERGIDPEVVLETIRSAILAAFRKDNPEYFEEEQLPEDLFEVDLDSGTGSAKIIDKETKEDVTPPGFGRIAAQTAKQVILQRVREAEKDAIIGEYQERIGNIISGMVLRFDSKNLIIDIGRGQGVMPPEEQTGSEYYKMNQRLSVYVKDIRETMRGKTIIVSRSTPELVRELFAREVPEVSSGAVEIRAVAREAGYRSKIAVHSTQEGVDPVGSCVGQKGVRVQEVINELNGEKIDIIQFSDDPKVFISAALAPAEGLQIEIKDDDEKAVVTVPDDQLSLAIGKGGQNVRLAAKLTGYKIDIVGESGEAISSESGDSDEESNDAESTSDADSIESLELSTRVSNALEKAEVTSVARLRDLIEAKEAIEGIGPKSLEEIKQALKDHAPAEALDGSEQEESETDSDEDNSEEPKEE